MEYNFFNHFIFTYLIVLIALIGWFSMMFIKGKRLIRPNKSKTGS